MMQKMTYLDVGCGKNKSDGYIGIDKITADNVDHVIDVDKSGLTEWAESSVAGIRSVHFIEHCENFFYVMNEFHRVLKPEGRLYLVAPYGNGYYWQRDPTHKCCVTEDTFRKYLCQPEYVKAYSDYGIDGFWKEINIIIYGRDILHLELHVCLEPIK